MERQEGRKDLSEYRPETLPEKYRWKGEGPAPAHWYAEDGTKVYRSYADYRIAKLHEMREE